MVLLQVVAEVAVLVNREKVMAPLAVLQMVQAAVQVI
jgi:hypothetical protein